MVGQFGLNLRDLSPWKPIILAEFYWSSGTVQIENRFITSSNHVNMSWPMIIRINNHAQTL